MCLQGTAHTLRDNGENSGHLGRTLVNLLDYLGRKRVFGFFLLSDCSVLSFCVKCGHDIVIPLPPTWWVRGILVFFYWEKTMSY